MISITVDDILLSYKDEITQQQFYNHLSNAFDITTPTNTTRIKFLSFFYTNPPMVPVLIRRTTSLPKSYLIGSTMVILLRRFTHHSQLIPILNVIYLNLLHWSTLN